MDKVILNTSGEGYWNSVAKAIRITDVQLGYIDEEFDDDMPEFGELRVYFDTATWDVRKDGLIYTDKLFRKELQELLTQHGLVGDDVEYSEQGMQGNDYVSCDVGVKFLESWGKKFGIDWHAMRSAQEAEFKARWG